MKRAENDLVYERPEIDNRVVNFVMMFCYFAIIQPDLVSRVDCEEEFGREFSSRCSFALKIDLCWFIMFARALMNWTPTLSSPKKILEATVNI